MDLGLINHLLIDLRRLTGAVIIDQLTDRSMTALMPRELSSDLSLYLNPVTSLYSENAHLSFLMAEADEKVIY